MAPHTIIFWTAAPFGLIGKLLFAQSSILVAFALPALLVAYYGPPSPLAVIIGSPITLIGAAVEVVAGKVLPFSRKASRP